MSQSAFPTSLMTTTWAGAYTDLADDNDATFIESPVDPEAADTFVCALGAVTDPGVATGHLIRVRAQIDPATGEPQDLVLALENVDDDSVVATRILTPPPNGMAERELTLTEAEAGQIHDYAGLRLRGYARAGQGYAFFWVTVGGATRYVLQIGTFSGGPWNIFDADVGYTLTYPVWLDAGTYYSQVAAYNGAAWISTTDEQEVTIP